MNTMRFPLIVSLLLSAFMLNAQEKIEMPLRGEAPEGFKVDMTDLNRDPALTVYRPKRPNGTAIIMCPGGGYSHQAAAHEGHDMSQWMNAQGVTYIVLKYRLPQGNPEVPVSDALDAIKLVRERAGEWKLNPRKIGIMGASAGGHLASSAATHWRDSLDRPDFQVLLYPVVTMDTINSHRGSYKNMLGDKPSAERIALYSNELQVRKDTPKAFIVLSADDRAVNPLNSTNYFTALNRAGVPVTLHIYPTGGHGWGFRDSFPYKRQWTDELEAWLRRSVF